jgi:hypothetical protein
MTQPALAAMMPAPILTAGTISRSGRARRPVPAGKPGVPEGYGGRNKGGRPLQARGHPRQAKAGFVEEELPLPPWRETQTCVLTDDGDGDGYRQGDHRPMGCQPPIASGVLPCQVKVARREGPLEFRSL